MSNTNHEILSQLDDLLAQGYSIDAAYDIVCQNEHLDSQLGDDHDEYDHYDHMD